MRVSRECNSWLSDVTVGFVIVAFVVFVSVILYPLRIVFLRQSALPDFVIFYQTVRSSVQEIVAPDQVLPDLSVHRSVLPEP